MAANQLPLSLAGNPEAEVTTRDSPVPATAAAASLDDAGYSTR